MSVILVRLLVIAGALVIWFWTQKLIARKAGQMEGIGDAVHAWTARWHGYFVNHETAANRALAVSSFFIDVLGFWLWRGHCRNIGEFDHDVRCFVVKRQSP